MARKPWFSWRFEQGAKNGSAGYERFNSMEKPPTSVGTIFPESRDKWKSKCQDVKADVKRFRNQAQDAKKSRDKWKSRVRGLECANQELQQELTRLTAEVESHREVKKGGPVS